MTPTINVELNYYDAELFKKFQKHYDLIDTLDRRGIFEIQFGKCILNFAGGHLQNIIKEEVVWHK